MGAHSSQIQKEARQQLAGPRCVQAMVQPQIQIFFQKMPCLVKIFFLVQQL